MKMFVALAVTLALAGCGTTSPPPQSGPTGWDYRADEDRALVALAKDIGFTGQLGISRRPASFHLFSLGLPDQPSNKDVWPWASVTKQVVATMVMQQVEAGTLSLDAPASRYLAGFGPETAPTIRQLVQHQSGLRNPDRNDEADNSAPSFLVTGGSGTAWCLAGRSSPEPDPHKYDYNNCDYIMLSAILAKVTGIPINALFDQSIAQPAKLANTGFLASKPDRPFMGAEPYYRTRIPRYGAGAGLVGPLEDMARFDRALMDGTLLNATGRKQLWAGNPGLDDMALGQWQYHVQLTGCAEPVSVIERRGGIGKYALRNFIVPGKDLVLVLATENRQFPFKDVRKGEGAAFNLLSKAACGVPA